MLFICIIDKDVAKTRNGTVSGTERKLLCNVILPYICAKHAKTIFNVYITSTAVQPSTCTSFIQTPEHLDFHGLQQKDSMTSK